MKRLRYAFEAVIVAIFMGIFRLCPPAVASAAGGWIGRTIGPHLAVSRRARQHLRASLPGRSETEYAEIVRAMWDNLGRVFAEYPHLEAIARTRTEFIGKEILTAPPPVILIAGHIANWEIAATTFFVHGIPMDLIYRAPNNPWVDALIKKFRSLHGKIETHPKSRAGMKRVVETLKAGKNLGILIDQKYNPGVEARFFGQSAMTSPAFVQLATKFSCPVHPVRVERLGGCHFRVTVHPPLETNDPVDQVIAAAHALLETWITERPGQWIWLHRRWKKAERVESPEFLAEAAKIP